MNSVRILYERGLDPLAAELAAMGFETARLEEGGAADAVLFASGAHAAMRVRPGAGGALLLNARGMNAAEAANAVRRRAREPIF